MQPRATASLTQGSTEWPFSRTVWTEDSPFQSSRLTPVVYKKTINDSNGTALVAVEVFEFEEVVDTVVCLFIETNTELYQISLKNYFFQNVCGMP